MARVIDNQANLWGRSYGAEAQRSDLWIVDFSTVLQLLNASIFQGDAMSKGVAQPFIPPKLATYHLQSVTLPDLKVRSEAIRRDSRPYQTPSWDEPLEAITFSFILDCWKAGKSYAVDPYRSDIYQLLDVWRAIVRAGRGGMSGEYAITLDDNYRIDYKADVQLNLMRGVSPQVIELKNAVQLTLGAAAEVYGLTSTSGLDLASTLEASGNTIVNDLAWSMKFKLINCWLASFKLSDLNYDAAQVVKLTATLYADDIQQQETANA
jgi:hypothetical protein